MFWSKESQLVPDQKASLSTVVYCWRRNCALGWVKSKIHPLNDDGLIFDSDKHGNECCAHRRGRTQPPALRGPGQVDSASSLNSVNTTMFRVGRAGIFGKTREELERATDMALMLPPEREGNNSAKDLRLSRGSMGLGCCKNTINQGCGWVSTIDVYFSQFWGLEVGGLGARKVRFGCGSTTWFADGRLFIVFFPGREQRQGRSSHLPPLEKALIPFVSLHSASQRPTSTSLAWRCSDCIMETWGETDTLSPQHHSKERDTDGHSGAADVHWHCPHKEGRMTTCEPSGSLHVTPIL